MVRCVPQTFRFIRWYDPEKRFAVFEDVTSGQEFIVPRSRIIPHPLCHAQFTLSDPNRIVEVCAEQQHFFGPEIFRWYMHKVWVKKDPMTIDEDDVEKAYYLPPHVDFSCVRDCILKGGKDADLCIAECSSW